MNIVQKLTLAHLRENKGRTVVTVLGICVSVAMITAVFVAVASFLNYFGELSLASQGYWQADVYEASADEISKIESDDKVSRVGLQANLPSDETGFKINNGKTNRTSTGSIYVADTTALQQRITCHYDGELPSNENEILVEKEFIESNNLDWKIGDTVSIPIGLRYSYSEDNQIVEHTGSYVSGEKFEEKEQREYKITGILNSNLPTRGYSIVRLASSEELKSPAAFVEIKDINMNSYAELTSIMKSAGVESSNYELNTDILAANFSFSADSDIASTLLPMAAIVLAIIIIASVMLIYNAFGMSLSERTRYLGMLSSVGATKQQKSLSVYFEGFILGIVGIPVGICAGILGIAITLKAVGARMVESGMVNGAEDVSFSTVVPAWIIVGIVIVSVFTIFISAMIPAKRASSVTPIAAIRQTNEIKLKAKSLKSSPLVRAIFGYEGELANKNLKRNGKKSRIITASIALSVILFLSVNTFCTLFVQANSYMAESPYQIYINLNNYDEYEKLKPEVKDTTGVDNVYSTSTEMFMYGSKDPFDNNFANQDITKNTDALTSKYSNLWDTVSVYVNYIDDEDFNALCEANGIDYTKYYETAQGKENEFKCVVMNNISHTAEGGEVFNDNIKGEVFYKGNFETKDGREVEIRENNTNPKAVITDLVKYDKDNYICNLNIQNSVSAYAPLSMYVKAYEKSYGGDVSLTMGVETKDSEIVTERIQAIVDEVGLDGSRVIDMNEATQVIQSTVFIISVFMYGFIALITLIALANIVNTISTGIDLRRKEFAMLKSVGTTPKGFRKMIALESIFYGMKALVFAIPISLVISYFMTKQLASNVIPFSVNIPLYLAVIAAVFIIVGVSMFFSVSKLKNDSIVETLKEDIC